MSYASFIKNLPELFSQPAGIAAIASLGIHGALGILLPLMPSQSQSATKPDTPKPVGLVNLSPQEQSRLPQNPVPTQIVPVPGAMPPVAMQPSLPPSYALGSNPLPPLGAGNIMPGTKTNNSKIAVDKLKISPGMRFAFGTGNFDTATNNKQFAMQPQFAPQPNLKNSTRQTSPTNYSFRRSERPNLAPAPLPIFPSNNPSKSIPAVQPGFYSPEVPDLQKEQLPPPPSGILQNPGGNAIAGDNPGQIALGPNQQFPGGKLPDLLSNSPDSTKDTTYASRLDKLTAGLFAQSMARRASGNTSNEAANPSVVYGPSANLSRALANLNLANEVRKRNPDVAPDQRKPIRETIISQSGNEGKFQGFAIAKANGEIELKLLNDVSPAVKQELINNLRDKVKPNTSIGFDFTLKKGATPARNNSVQPQQPQITPEQPRSPESSSSRQPNSIKPQPQSTPTQTSKAPSPSNQTPAGNTGISWKERLRPSNGTSLGDKLRGDNDSKSEEGVKSDN